MRRLSVLIFLFLWLSAPYSVLAADLPPTYAGTMALQSQVGGGGSFYYNHNTDRDGNICAAGYFSGTMDVDPTSGADVKTASHSFSPLLTKFSSDGSYLWSKTLNIMGYFIGLSFDNNGSMYITTDFYGSGDLDWSSGVDTRSSSGGADTAITKILEDGTYSWTKVWGGAGHDDPMETPIVDIDGYVYIPAKFNNSVDFDPSNGVYSKTSVGGSDCAVSLFDTNGNFLWTKTWGGTGLDSLFFADISPDRQHLYFSGGFSNTVDFDPGPGVVSRTSAGSYDGYLLKLSLDGTYESVLTLGSTGSDNVNSVIFDGENNMYLGGTFSNTVDFDLGIGTDSRTSNGNQDAYLTKFSSSGSYMWTKTFGGIGRENINFSMTGDKLYGLGAFDGTVDFDPGTGTDIKTAANGPGGWDGSFFVSQYDLDGNYLWSHTSTGGIYSGGDYMLVFNNSIWAFLGVYGTVDFDPYGSHDYVTGEPDMGDAAIVKFTLPTYPASTVIGASNTGETPQIPFSKDGNEKSGVLLPIKDSNTGGQSVTIQIQPKTLGFDAFVSAIKQSPKDLLSSLLFSAGKVILTSANTLGIKTSGGTAWQVGNLQKIHYKAYSPKDSGKEPAVILPSLQSKPSIISLSYKDTDLIPPGDRLHPFKPSSLKLAYSEDGKSWKILPSSVVDTTNKTVSAIDTLGGYYMIVSGGSTSTTNTTTPSKNTVLGATTSRSTQTEIKPDTEQQNLVDSLVTPTTPPTTETPSPTPPPAKPKTCLLWWCW